LAKSVTAVAFTKGAAAGGSTLALVKGALNLMEWSKAKTAIGVGVAAILVVGTMAPIVAHHYRNASMYSSLGGMTQEQTAQTQQATRVLFEAVGNGDWNKVNALCRRGEPLADLIDPKIKARLIGLELVSLGEPFVETNNFGISFVPYEIRLKNGETHKHRLGMIRSYRDQKWVCVCGISGGLSDNL
jgi:hypothetical protein